MTLRNNDPKLPYLAQSWIEDEKGNKITSPLTVLPPVQRIDSMMNGQVKVQGMPDINKLPADRESMFYFNVREIPPKSNKPNTPANRAANAYQVVLATKGAGKGQYEKSVAAQGDAHPQRSGIYRQ